MNLRHIEFFVTVVDVGGFTDAAAQLRVTQSTVSTGVASLEKSLGGALLERSAHGLALTALGRRLLPTAREIVVAARRLRDGGREAHLIGRLRLGIVTGVEHLDLPDVLSGYRARHAHVDVSLRVHPEGSSGLIHDVQRGRLDAAIISCADAELPELITHTLSTRRMVLLVPSAHRLAERRQVTLEEVAHEDFVDMPHGFGTREQNDRDAAARGLSRRVALEISDQRAIADYVARGLGVAVTTRPSSTPDGVAVLAVADLAPQHVSVIHRACPALTVEPFVDLLLADGQRPPAARVQP